MKATAALAGWAVVLASGDALACNFDEPSWKLEGPTTGYPPNAALVIHDIWEAVVEVDDVEAALVPANLPGLGGHFVDPLPENGDQVHIAEVFDMCAPCQCVDVVMGEQDVAPPELSTPLYFDLDKHPFESDLGGPPYDLTYVVRTELRGRRPRTGFHRRLRPGRVAVVPPHRVDRQGKANALVDSRDLGDTLPERVALSVRLADLAGNGLAEVRLAAPCHLTLTASNQYPVWSDETLFPGGVCTSEMAPAERVPGLAPLPEEASSCSVGGRGSAGSWLAAAWFAMATIRRRERSRRAHGRQRRVSSNGYISRRMRSSMRSGLRLIGHQVALYAHAITAAIGEPAVPVILSV